MKMDPVLVHLTLIGALGTSLMNGSSEQITNSDKLNPLLKDGSYAG